MAERAGPQVYSIAAHRGFADQHLRRLWRGHRADVNPAGPRARLWIVRVLGIKCTALHLAPGTRVVSYVWDMGDWTPDEVRGRVNAVNMVFVGASNELGEFRAGTMAHFIGPVPAVVLGGFGTLAVATMWALGFPQLRKIDSLEVPERQEAR